MDYVKLRNTIQAAIRKTPGDVTPYEDLFSLCREYREVDFTAAHEWNHALRGDIGAALRSAVGQGQFDAAEQFNNLLFRSLLFGAPYFFDDYLQAVEFGKPADKKFYQPRRHYLKRYVDAYQEILDGKLDFLSISMPKRAGKSQLGINFTNMLSGKFPDRASLMEGTGDDLVNSFYKGCLEYLQQPNEYHFYDIFPESRLVQTNADNKTINLLHKSRFPTIMCRSIDARQVGLSEATNLLYLDDCVEGREEAKNRNRLDDKWEVISGDIIGRAIEGTPIVICGTRYSLYDPIGHLQEEMEKQGKRMKVIETPALDPVTDESNFQYMREGKPVLAKNANNCFGMKKNLSGNTWAGSTWDGKSVYPKQTQEQNQDGSYTTITADFRKYDCVEDSIADHSAYLLGAKKDSGPRYAGLAGEKDYKTAAQIIKDGGYATALTYVDSLCKIIEKWDLTRFDVKDTTKESEEKEKEKEMRYNKISEMPSYAQATVKEMVDKGIIGGTGTGAKDEDGRPADLDLSRDMLRVFVTNDRAGVYGD